MSWWYAAAERAFKKILFQQSTVSIDDVVAEFQEACPQALGILPLALMSGGLLFFQEHRAGHADSESIRKILEVLPDCGQGQIVPMWLVGSGKWLLSKDGSRTEIDLLDVFLDELG